MSEAELKRVPKTQRGKRALHAREPKLVENTKTGLFLYGTRTSEMVKYFFTDLLVMTKPHTKSFSRKKEILPFDDPEPLEYLSRKQDASFFIFGNHNKKRPNNVTFGRTFNYQLLDMVEMGLDSLRPMQAFSSRANVLGSKPALVFNGDIFETDPLMKTVKSIFTDMFRGAVVDNINIEGIDHVISVTAVEGRVHFRHYAINFKKSGTRIPLVELDEIGPRADLSIRRSRLAADDLWKEATTKPKNLRAKKQKNTEHNVLGDKLGRIHMQKQDINNLQTRKVRALKKGASEVTTDDSDEPAKKKRKRKTGSQKLGLDSQAMVASRMAPTADVGADDE
eukprot:m.143700 g.143700  ORF g.143700 m.143700 type:complete len:337 (+) comp30332_c0_seq1:225-1235(+)